MGRLSQWSITKNRITKIGFGVVLVLVLVLFTGSIREILVRNIAFVNVARATASLPDRPTNKELRSAYLSINQLNWENDDRYSAISSRLIGIERSLENEEYVQSKTGWLALENAHISLLQGEAQKGQELLQQAVTTGTPMIQLSANLRLAQLLGEQGNSAGYNRQMEMLAAEVSTTMPWTDACPGWTLEAAYWDNQDLVLDQPVHILLVWRAPLDMLDRSTTDLKLSEGQGTDDWQFWGWRDLLFQMGTAQNLVPDGGFEGTVLPHTGTPWQLPFVIGGNSGHSALIYKDIQQSENMTLLLDGRGETSVSLSTQPIQLSTNVLNNDAYLVVGDYRSTETATPLIGIRWLLEDAQTFQDNISTNVVYKQPSLDWTSFTGLLVPPDNAWQLQYWVVNADPTSELQVDNLGLWRVPLPCHDS